MHSAIAHHPPTDAQPVPEQRPPRPAFPSLCPEHDVTWYGMSLWPVWLCPLPASCAPPAFSVGRAWKTEKSLASVSIT